MSTPKTDLNHQQFDHQLIAELPNLRRIAWRYSGNEQDRDDLVQETVTRAELNWFRFAQGTNLRGWLFTIMRNVFINGYRHAQLENTAVERTDEFHSDHLPESAGTNLGEAHFVSRDIQAALSCLPSLLHTAFSLYYQGYRYHEIAEIMHTPIGPVKTRIHLARKFLKQRLRMYETRSVA
jgi:RNA polymerase sigma-70 factor (ECF subfamily)